MVNNAQRKSTCAVERGLYVLRYVSSNAGRGAPLAFARPAPGCEADVQVITAPGHASGELPAPGVSVVILAQAPSTLEITIRAREDAGSMDAQFNLELLGKGGGVERAKPGVEMPAWSARQPATRPPAPEAIDLEFLAHISRRGDVRIDDGEWAAGPNQPAPIEGIELHCVGGDLAVEAQFTNSRDGRWSPWMTPGTFIGTRGQAKSLTGLRLRLVGRSADQFLIHGDALFLGSPVVSQQDRAIDLVSSTGVDPLVGLRLQIKSTSSQDEMPVLAKPPRVRVFRAAKPGFNP